MKLCLRIAFGLCRSLISQILILLPTINQSTQGIPPQVSLASHGLRRRRFQRPTYDDTGLGSQSTALAAVCFLLQDPLAPERGCPKGIDLTMSSPNPSHDPFALCHALTYVPAIELRRQSSIYHLVSNFPRPSLAELREQIKRPFVWRFRSSQILVADTVRQ
jgi:hypothetical protein